MPLHSNKNDSAHFNSVEKKAGKVQAVLDNLITDIVKNALLSNGGTSDGIFSFDKHPRLKRYFDSIVKQVTQEMVRVINDQTKDSWARGSKKAIDAVIPTLRNNSVLLKAVKNSSEINLNALQSFQKRKTNGMNLSDRVWNITKTFKQEMEFALDLSIAEGKSAQDISKEVRKLLKNPNKASMMIRDKHGNKTMKKLEKGVYQSSYKNAMRLARTENNIAYHSASYDKYNEFDFVVGIEVRLSNNLAHCPFCQSMAGKYPKDFKFTGWHPQCRCTTIPILKTPEEMQEDNDSLAQGKEVSSSSVNEVKTPNKAFMDYIALNRARIEGLKSKPYFYQDNMKYTLGKKDVAIEKINSLAKGKIFDDAKLIDSIFEKAERSWSEVIEAFEKNNSNSKLEYVNIKDIKITQPNIQGDKVKKMLENPDDLPVINVVKFKDGTMAIFDGHHRLSASWALGETKIKVNLVKVKAEKTEAQKKKIQDKWDKRKALHKGWISDYQKLKTELLQFPNDFDTSSLDNLFKEYRLIDLANETNIKKIELVSLKGKIKGLEKSISNAESFVKEHGFEKVLEAKNAAELKIKSFDNLGIDYKIKKLEFEIDWVEKNKKYPTWNVAQEVYKKELIKTEFSKSVNESKNLFEEIKAKGKGWKAQKYKDLIKDVEDKILLVNAELLDFTQIAELNKSIKKLSDYTDETVAKKLALASKPKKVKGASSAENFDEVIDFDDLPKSVIDDLIDKFENESLSVEEVDSLLRKETKEYWKTISEKERVVLTKYTQTFSYLNEPLRNMTYYGDKSKKKEFVVDMSLLTEALSKYRLKDNLVVRRGTKDFSIDSIGKKLSNLKVGDVFNDGAFLSTATHKTKGFYESYEMIIVYPKGAMGVYAEPFSGYNKGDYSYQGNIWNGLEDVGIGKEQEWIGQRGSRFKVIKKSGNKIFLQVIGQLYKH